MTRLLTLLFLALLLPQWSSAAPLSVQGSGSASVVGGDRELAEQLAARGAKRQALEQAVNKLLDSPLQKEDFQKRKGLLWSKLETAVRKTTVLDTWEEGSKVHQSLVLMVDRDALLGLLKANELRSAAEDPLPRRRIIIIVDEAIQGVYGQLGIEENFGQADITLGKLLQKKGYIVLDNQLLIQKLKREKTVQHLVGNVAVAAAMGLEQGAEYVITGQAKAKQSNVSLGDLKTNIANVSLKMIESDSARVVAVESGTATQPHIDEVAGGRQAIEKALEKAGAALLKQADQEAAAHNTRTVALTVSGLSHFQLALLKRILSREIKSVSELHQRSYVNQLARLELHSPENSDVIADEITLKDFGAFRLRVDAVSAKEITAALLMKQE